MKLKTTMIVAASLLALAAATPASAQYMGNDGYQSQRDGRTQSGNRGGAYIDEMERQLRNLFGFDRNRGRDSGMRAPTQHELEGRHPRQ